MSPAIARRSRRQPNTARNGASTGRRNQAIKPDRDIGLETLALVLDKKIPVQMHCYRADQMATMIDVAKEFGFRIAAFHHATEAYKVADLLKKNGICAVNVGGLVGLQDGSL